MAKGDRFLARVKAVGTLETTVLAGLVEDHLATEQQELIESLFPAGRPNVEEIDFDDVPPRFPEERKDLACGECGALMTIRDGKFSPFYGCTRYPDCSGTHGAHPDGKPKGTPGNKDTKRARIRAHLVFDQIWKQKLQKHRGGAYAWMRRAMNLTAEKAHIGDFTAEQCEELVRLVYRDYPSLRDRYAHLLYSADPFEAVGEEEDDPLGD